MPRKLERIFNLVALLLDTARPLTAEEIRAKIPGYEGQSDAAFKRMFERDKEELREMGIPVERVATDAWEAEDGYHIPRDALLDDPGLTPAEAAALSLAAQAWAGQVAGANPAVAMLKLSLGADAEPGGRPWLLPRIEPTDPNLETLVEAISRRKAVSFRYRRGGGEPPAERAVDPWLLVHRGTWYLAGRDHARDEVRRFKLSRVEGRVRVAPGSRPDFDPPDRSLVEPFRAPWEGDGGEARVALHPRAAWWAERRTGARRVATRPDGWVELALLVGDQEQLVAWILGFGEDAEVLAPGELRTELIRRLEALA